MPGILWRILIAMIAVVLVYLLIPPVARILGFPVSGDVFTVVKVCVAGIAVFYILTGWRWPAA